MNKVDDSSISLSAPEHLRQLAVFMGMQSFRVCLYQPFLPKQIKDSTYDIYVL